MILFQKLLLESTLIWDRILLSVALKILNLLLIRKVLSYIGAVLLSDKTEGLILEGGSVTAPFFAKEGFLW